MATPVAAPSLRLLLLHRLLLLLLLCVMMMWSTLLFPRPSVALNWRVSCHYVWCDDVVSRRLRTPISFPVGLVVVVVVVVVGILQVERNGNWCSAVFRPPPRRAAVFFLQCVDLITQFTPRRELRLWREIVAGAGACHVLCFPSKSKRAQVF